MVTNHLDGKMLLQTPSQWEFLL